MTLHSDSSIRPFCNAGTKLPREGLDGSSLSTPVQMVFQIAGAGIGVTLIPEMAREVETRSAQVAVSEFGNPRQSRSIGMIWRRASPIGVQLARISEVVRDASLELRITSVGQVRHPDWGCGAAFARWLQPSITGDARATRHGCSPLGTEASN